MSWELLQWREVAWLWLAAYPLLLWSLAWLGRLWRRQDWLDAGLLPWMRYRRPGHRWHWLWQRGWLWGAAWVLLAIALAGPRLPQSVAGSEERALRDVMVVLDLSRSMTATDIAPSRLARGKQTLQALLRQGRDSRYGLVVYGLTPHLMFPLTADRRAALHYLEAVVPGLLPGEGSLLQPALQLAQQELGEGQRPRAILWISDGEVSDESALEAALQGLRERGIRLIIYALGSTQGSGLQTARGEWLQHEGQAVVSATPHPRLHRLAERYGALYLSWGGSGQDWLRIYEQGIAPLALRSEQISEGGIRLWRELYAPFLYAGLALLWLSLLGRRPVRAPGLALLLALGLWGSSLPHPAWAAEPAGSERAAYRAYAAGDYELAWQRYGALTGFAARMGQGQAAYAQQRYGAARQQFQLAFLAADEDRARAAALFNMANSAYQQGDYGAAVPLYEDVLRYRPGHEAAELNLAYARELLQEVELFRNRQGGRPGRGPRTAPAEAGQELGQQSATLGEEKTEPVAFSWSDEERQARIIKGVEYAELASSASDTSPPVDELYEISDMAALQRARLQPQRQQSLFWRRLFAQEEGLGAVPAEPLTREGVVPW